MTLGSRTVLRRRRFLAASAAAMLWPNAIAAPPSSSRRVVWIFPPGNPASVETFKGRQWGAARDLFASFGFVEGQNLVLTVKVMPDGAAAEAYVNKLVASAPDAIVMVAMEEMLMLMQATRRIPIVFYNLGVDPSKVGAIESVRRPGANMTGTFLGWEEIQTRQLQAFKVLVPSMKRIGSLAGKERKAQLDKLLTTSPIMRKSMPLHEAARKDAAAKLGIEVREILVSEEAARAEIAAAVNAAGVDGLMVDFVTPQLLDYLRAARMPSCGIGEGTAKQGVLLAMCFDWQEGEHEAMRMVARILQGTDPATLPAYRHNRYYLAVNRTTAREIGVAIPESILIQAEKIFD